MRQNRISSSSSIYNAITHLSVNFDGRWINMPANKPVLHKLIVVIVDPEMEKPLGRISLVGGTLPSTEWIRGNGPLQSFEVVDGWDRLRNVWISQKEVILRTDYVHRRIRIVTYPTEGENQGYLDFTSDFVISPKPSAERKARLLFQRGFSYLQSLFSI